MAPNQSRLGRAHPPTIGLRHFPPHDWIVFHTDALVEELDVLQVAQPKEPKGQATKQRRPHRDVRSQAIDRPLRQMTAVDQRKTLQLMAYPPIDFHRVRYN